MADGIRDAANTVAMWAKEAVKAFFKWLISAILMLILLTASAVTGYIILEGKCIDTGIAGTHCSVKLPELQ